MVSDESNDMVSGEHGMNLIDLKSVKSFFDEKQGVPSCSSQMAMSGGRITDKFLRSIPPMCLGFAFNVEKKDWGTAVEKL